MPDSPEDPKPQSPNLPPSFTPGYDSAPIPTVPRGRSVSSSQRPASPQEPATTPPPPGPTPNPQPQAAPGPRRVSSSTLGHRSAQPQQSGGATPPAIGAGHGPSLPTEMRVPAASGRTRKRLRRNRWLIGTAAVLALLLAWPIGLLIWANSKVHHIEALSGAPDTPGTTYLIVGNDSREGWRPNTQLDDGGMRADTIMLLHAPKSGPTALISIPRDSYVDIPGHKANKINAAYAFGGPKLLVATVEGLSGLTVDHYVEIGFNGVEQLVTAVGGVELCLDYDVNDDKSKLVWTKGCHLADGPTALAFSRMRYSDPKGDIGRGERQRQVIKAIGQQAVNPKNVLPNRAIPLAKAGLNVVSVSEGSSIVDLGRLFMSFRHAQGPDGVTGTPPIASLNYRPGGVGSAVQLDPDTTPQFFRDLRDGKLPAGTVPLAD